MYEFTSYHRLHNYRNGYTPYFYTMQGDTVPRESTWFYNSKTNAAAGDNLPRRLGKLIRGVRKIHAFSCVCDALVLI